MAGGQQGASRGGGAGAVRRAQVLTVGVGWTYIILAEIVAAERGLGPGELEDAARGRVGAHAGVEAAVDDHREAADRDVDID